MHAPLVPKWSRTIDRKIYSLIEIRTDENRGDLGGYPGRRGSSCASGRPDLNLRPPDPPESRMTCAMASSSDFVITRLSLDVP